VLVAKQLPDRNYIWGLGSAVLIRQNFYRSQIIQLCTQLHIFSWTKTKTANLIF